MKNSIRLKDLVLEIKKEKLNTDEYEKIKKRFGSDRPCSFAKDNKGYYCYTHRARSKSYKTIDSIPMKDYKFICSTS